MSRRANLRVLAVDDDSRMLDTMHALLEQPDREVLLARSRVDLESYYAAPAPDVVLLDWRLPDGDGMQMLPGLKRRWPLAQIILMSGQATTENIVQAIKHGAYHFQAKPFSADDLLRLVDEACNQKQRTQSTDAALAEPGSESGEGILWPVAEGRPMQEILRLTAQVAPNDLSVLITGESGTGKKVIAGLLHALSLRANGPLVKVNCATLAGDLLEAELFGSAPGAGPDASTNRNGRIREAAGGTLFVDEITELPLRVQTRLLQALRERAFQAADGQSIVKVDCRTIAATNHNPMQAVADGELRADLYYRLGAIRIHLPPLRERPEDIIPLADQFLDYFAARQGRPPPRLSPAAAEAIRRFPWPGNVRQLRNELQRALLRSEHQCLDARDLPFLDPSAEAPEPDSNP